MSFDLIILATMPIWIPALVMIITGIGYKIDIRKGEIEEGMNYKTYLKHCLTGEEF